VAKTNRILYFDCFAGASGDMIIGALLDLGLDLELLKAELAKLGLEGYEIRARKIMKSGFSATKFDVLDKNGRLHDHGYDNDSDHVRHDEYYHRPHHNPDYDLHHGDQGHHEDFHRHHHEHFHHKNLSDIVYLIEQSQLPADVKGKSIAIFNRLAAAEAKIHGTVTEEVHFHEVGAMDAIIDIVGAVIGVHLLGIDRILVSPLPAGKGFVQCQHGIIPVPAPAAIELLQGMTMYGSEHEGETVTPTGAAIVSTLAEACGPMPEMTIVKVGYGAGTREFAVPNVLRAVMGEEITKDVPYYDCSVETVAELEANIDDMNPEFFDYIFDRLLKNGALDVFLLPVQMKKNRPATILKVLCAERDLHTMAGLLFTETSTIGVRVNRWQRFCLRREVIRVQTEFGEVRVKQAMLDGKIVNQAPEYEDCKEIARACKIPLKQVYQAAMRSCGGSP
jgi:hypothetical protein